MIKLNGLYGTGYGPGPAPLDGAVDGAINGFLELSGLGLIGTKRNPTAEGKAAGLVDTAYSPPSTFSKVTGYVKKNPVRVGLAVVLGLWAAKKIKLPVLGKRK